MLEKSQDTNNEADIFLNILEMRAFFVLNKQV